ncbi:Cht7 [Cordylochernes scorpioides]|uniref:Cht7 n=1 Tax=Cordylochernes scorpioides TaxID=51811 RepID=A0ABY6K6R3_9ARAC|nr:Cht7 [Cordylochernes scorpioides]
MEQKLKQRICIEICVKLQISATETFKMPNKAFPNDPPKRTTMILGKNAQNVQKITDLIKENPRTTLLELEQDTGISKTTIGRIVTKDLKLKKTPAKFIPRFLTNEQKLCRLATCENMLEMTRTDPEWKDKIITGDETWVYDYDPETKRQYAEWRGQGEPRPKKSRILKSRNKVLLVAFLDNKGIGSDSKKMPEKWPNGDWILHHDNARPHTAHFVTSFLAKIGTEILPHPSYSLDIAPNDFFLFPKLKAVLKGRHFDTRDDIIEKSLLALKSIPKELYKNCFDNLGKRWRWYVDFINIMSYDFHGKWESQTGHNSPLYPPANETNWRKQLCVDFGVKLWERLGAPKDKIVVGMATYGRSFTLANKEAPGYNVASRGGGKAGEYTREEGFLAYYEICEMLKKGARYVWDDVQKVPYAHLDDQWVGFDDERSLRIKSRWVMENDYGGAMIWTVDMDDFRGVCKGRSFALISAIKDELEGKSSSSVADNILITQASQRRLVTGNDLPSTRRTKPPKAAVLADQEEDEEAETEAPVNKDETNARVVCYFTNWAQKRPGLGRFDPEHIDPELCTHVLLAFATIQDNQLAASDQGEAPDSELYSATLALKEKNPSLRVLVSVGGWMLGSKPFRQLTTSTYRKMNFIFQVIEYLRQHKLDGLDLDWEFPKGAQDKERLTGLIKDLREAFDGESRNAEKPRLLLSTTVPASFEAVSAGYNIAEINKYVDMINVLSYDFHGAWERHVGHPSPLFPLEAESAFQKKLTVDYSAAELVRKGAAKEKLVIGMATYGRTFTLANSSLTDIGAPARDGGKPGKYTRESGFLAFYEICELLKNGATLVWDNEQMVPYAFVDDQWVGFDDQRSIKLKVQWLKQSGYGGVMIWAVDLDDFRGSCIGEPYPLLKAVREELKGYQVANLEAQPSDVHSATSQLIDKNEVICDEADGHITYHIDKKDCTKYYMCEGKRRHHMPCPNQLVFNLQESVCDWPENVPDCYKAQSSVAT